MRIEAARSSVPTILGDVWESLTNELCPDPYPAKSANVLLQAYMYREDKELNAMQRTC
jgi:hypothetical protein